MRKLLMLVAFVFLAALPTYAQDDYPSAEIFGGYAYFNADIIDRESLHGFGVSFAGNFGPKFGAVAEISGTYGNIDVGLADLDLQTYTYLFGPRISARGETATAFAHILLGAGTTKIESASDTRFALAAGGGVDVNAGSRIAFRFQADYIPIFFEGDTAHNFRFMTGIVFKVGGN